MPTVANSEVMAFEAATLLQLMLLITWTCLSDTPVNQKHVYFTRFLTSQVVLKEKASAVNLVFADGLLEVLQDTVPPTVAYFKTLPTDTTKRWAIYLLVLEKPKCRPRIYIGSGTNNQYGVHRRLRTYDSKHNLPRYVEKSLDEGYKIVHKVRNNRKFLFPLFGSFR
jgi:hypothetical protein